MACSNLCLFHHTPRLTSLHFRAHVVRRLISPGHVLFQTFYTTKPLYVLIIFVVTMNNTVLLSQGRNLAGKVGFFPENHAQSSPPDTNSSPVVMPETAPLSSAPADKAHPPAASLPSIEKTRVELLQEATVYNNTMVDLAPNESTVAVHGGVMQDTTAMSEHRWALDAVDSDSPSPPLPSSIHKVLAEIGITPLQLVNRFTRELLEQAHRSEALMDRAEPSMETPEAAVALARRAEASIRLREAAVQKKEAELNLKELETQRREAELDRREEEVRLKEADARRKEEDVARKAKGAKKKEAKARLLEETAQQSLEVAQRIESSAREAEASAKVLKAEAQLRDAKAQAREVEVLVLETEAKEEARRLEGRFEHLLEQIEGIISVYRQEVRGPRIVPKTPKTGHQPGEQPGPSQRQFERQTNRAKGEIQDVEEQLLEAALTQQMTIENGTDREADVVSLTSTIRSTSSNRTPVGHSSKSNAKLKEDSEKNSDERLQQLAIERRHNDVCLESDPVLLASSIRDTFKDDNVDVSPTSDVRLKEGSEDYSDEGSDGFTNVSSTSV